MKLFLLFAVCIFVLAGVFVGPSTGKWELLYHYYIQQYPLWFPAGTCNENEEYNECGSSCTKTCTSDPRWICLAVCVPRCNCKMGYVRNESGKCILKSDCPWRVSLFKTQRIQSNIIMHIHINKGFIHIHS